jgi:hypothetical protein
MPLEETGEERTMTESGPKSDHPIAPAGRRWSALLALEPPSLSGFDDPLVE